MAHVSLEKVDKTFRSRSGEPFVALKGVDLQIEKGEFISVIGHSGCGKSTVLNLVAGLVDKTSGSIVVGGKSVEGPGPERMVVFQNHSLLPWLTLRQNVALAVDRVHGDKPAAERRSRVQHYIDIVHLTKAADRFPHQVSGGMKQRAGIARGLAVEPSMLLLDEPFGALDALTRAKLQDQLVKIWEANRITVLMVTHDVEEALLLSDRIVMMSNGPAARVAEIMTVDLPRPRERIAVIDHPSYYKQRGELLYFLNKCKKSKASTPIRSPAETVPQGVPAFVSGLEKEELEVGFVPLLDCLPFAVALQEGLFARHKLKVRLSREPSWKSISDGLREGRLDAAQMVTGMPIAETLGLGGREPFPVCTAMTLSRGGNAITFGRTLYEAGVTDRAGLERLCAARRDGELAPLTFGMVHPASMHNLLLRAWLAEGNIDPDEDLELVVIPPPQMVANLEAGNISGYCVGEPWNLRAVQARLGFVCATDADIWAHHPEKVLGVSSAWARRFPKTHLALVSALLEACALCDDPEYRAEKAPELLAKREYVGGRPRQFTACLTGPYDYGHGMQAKLEDFVVFSQDSANLCRTNETLWLMAQLDRWGQCAFGAARGVYEQVYLESVLREAAGQVGTELAAQDLAPLSVVGGPLFDPGAPAEYLQALTIRRASPTSPSDLARGPIAAA